MRSMTPEEKKKHLADLPRYMPEHLAKEFLDFLTGLFARWVNNARTVIGDVSLDAEVPVGFWPFLVQTTLAVGVTEWAKEYGSTDCLVTMLEALAKFAVQAEGVDMAEFLRSEPVKWLAEARALLKPK